MGQAVKRNARDQRPIAILSRDLRIGMVPGRSIRDMTSRVTSSHITGHGETMQLSNDSKVTSGVFGLGNFPK